MNGSRGPYRRILLKLSGEALQGPEPSGIDAESGAVAGVAVQASVTVAFGAPKLGSLLSPARALTGRLVAVEIGFPPC